MSHPVRRYSIATCWDDGLLHGLADLTARTGSEFEHVFGAFQQGFVGNARQAYRLPVVSPETVARHIRLAAELGISYVHLLNAPQLGGDISDAAWRRDLEQHLEALHRIGVRNLTIANEELLRYVLERYPGVFEIKLSLIAGVETVERAREFEDLGVNVITLNPFALNRDFETLTAIRASVDCELELYANIPCLHECPLWKAHYRYLGASTQSCQSLNPEPDPYLQFCSRVFLENPVEMLRSPFIRPEDVDHYFEIGIDRIKLSDRAEGTDFLLKTASSYAARAYSGNLFQLVFRDGSKFRAALGPSPAVTPDPLQITIDNDALSDAGFLDRIRGLRGPELDRFYEELAADVVSVRGDSADAWLEALRAAPSGARQRGIALTRRR